MRAIFSLLLIALVVAHTSHAATPNTVYEDVPDISDEALKKIMSWIRQRTTSARLPFCWRLSYGRGVGKVPGRVADCPHGFTNLGATCSRGAEDIYSPSKAANCPKDFRHTGYTCFRPLRTYGKKCSLPWKKHRCRSGYRDIGCLCSRPAASRGMSSMRCRSGYFLSKLSGRCHKNCPSGYTNTGESCHRALKTLNTSHMTCKKGEHRILARCYGGRSSTSCFKNQDPDAGLCYKKCRSGYYGVGPVCWQRCNAGWTNCGAACTSTALQCATNVVNQVVSPILLAINIASFGLSTGGTKGAQTTLQVGSKTITSSTKIGKLMIKTVKSMQSVRPTFGTYIGKVNVVRRIYIARTGTLLSKAATTGSIASQTYTNTVRYTTMYAKKFAQMTSSEINKEIDRRFVPKTATFIKGAWAMQQLAEMSEANGWGIASSVLQAVSLVDITGTTAVVSAYAKPKCKDHYAFPCSPYLRNRSKCQ